MRVLTYSELLKKQNELNEVTVPSWRRHLCREDYELAMIEEVSELLATLPWKWWEKTDSIQYHRLKSELIDIVHFYLSIVILESDFSEKALNSKVGTLCDFDPDKQLIQQGRLNRQSFMKVFKTLLNKPNIVALEQLIVDLGVTGEEVSAYYTAIQALKVFRQHAGYGTGRYDKVKEGFEDNERLVKPIKAFLTRPSMTLSELSDNVSSALRKAYGSMSHDAVEFSTGRGIA